MPNTKRISTDGSDSTRGESVNSVDSATKGRKKVVLARSAKGKSKSSAKPVGKPSAIAGHTKKGQIAGAGATSADQVKSGKLSAKVGKKPKLVRDSFTMPASEYESLSEIKKRCLAKGVAAKKSEVLRAAIASLAAASDATLLKAIKRLEIIKTGRPAKGKA